MVVLGFSLQSVRSDPWLAETAVLMTGCTTPRGARVVCSKETGTLQDTNQASGNTENWIGTSRGTISIHVSPSKDIVLRVDWVPVNHSSRPVEKG